MTIEQLRRLHEARPFKPFRIHIADGRAFEIRHPEFLARFPSGRTMFVVTGDEAYEIIDLLLVTTLEVLEGSGAGGKGNGEAKGKKRKGS
ncbi:MAG: hypothetical protein KY476_26430 [Planctomycetes bacterium]|nr:hypothetical protein [Planctomycetota bacterium]